MSENKTPYGVCPRCGGKLKVIGPHVVCQNLGCRWFIKNEYHVLGGTKYDS